MNEGDDVARVRQQVDHLREKFVRRTQADAGVLRAFSERLRAGQTDVLPELEHVAHKIHGSAAIFGYPALSACAGDVEHLTEQLRNAEGRTDDSTAQTLQQLTDRIENLAEIAGALTAGA